MISCRGRAGHTHRPQVELAGRGKDVEDAEDEEKEEERDWTEIVVKPHTEDGEKRVHTKTMLDQTKPYWMEQKNRFGL